MKSKTAILFSGQGSQYIGMGKDLYEKYDYVKELFSEANEITGYNFEELIFLENDLLNQTKYTQVAVILVTCAIFEVFKREIGFDVEVVSGFSLGEYSALYASGVFTFKETMELVFKRANFMDEVAKVTKGKMAAVLGMEKDELNLVLSKFNQVTIANYNSPGQLVISGIEEEVEKVCEVITKEYRKRAIILNVSGGFHSPLMKKAANDFALVLDDYLPKVNNLPIIMNYNAQELVFENIKDAMIKQIYSPVYFLDTIEKMIKDYSIEEFIEIGPGKVLSGLVKRTDKTKSVINIENLKDIEMYKELKQ